MAEVADLVFRPLPDDDDDAVFLREEVDEALDLIAPFFSAAAASLSSSSSSDRSAAAATAGSPFPGETVDPHDFPLLASADDMGSDYLGLHGAQDNDHDGFFPRPSVPQAAGARPGSFRGEGLRIVEFGLDSDSEDDRVVASAVDDRVGDDDLAPPLCWDCVGIDPVVEEEGDDFEWEEVDGCLSTMLNADEGGSASRSNHREELDDSEEGHDDDIAQGLRDFEWELLLAMNNHGAGGAHSNYSASSNDAEPYLGDDHNLHTSEFEVLFGQFMDHVDPTRGSPPAAKLVVKSLPCVLMTEEEVAKGSTLCAVCKDEISSKEKARQLPCSHHFHGNCILPWLAMRNSCPVCRYELPTDDPEYENWRAQRVNRAGLTLEEPVVRYDFDSFPDA